MHPNPSYRKTPESTNIDFVRARGFGALSINGPDVPMCSHIPFWLSDDASYAEAHLVRSNPIFKALQDGPKPALLAVSGPDAYMSPDWYEIDDQVPTWNYVAVHLIGELQLSPQQDLLAHLDRLSGFFEAGLLPKPVWMTSKVTPDALARMMRMIAPVKFAITKIDATWKLAQPKGAEARLASAKGLRASGSETPKMWISELMMDLPTEPQD